MFSFIIKFLLIVFIIVILIGSFRTWQMQNDLRQEMFSRSAVPSPLPNGFYKGTVSGQQSYWLGKKFDASNSNGTNVFDGGFNIKNERYAFTTYLGKESYNKNHSVIKIDYNVSKNPFWLRIFLDEIVQIAPNQYLGKLQIKLIPGLPFSLLYFELQKTD